MSVEMTCLLGIQNKIQAACGYDDVMDSWKNIQMCKYKIFILNLSFAKNEFMQQVLVHDFKKK